MQKNKKVLILQADSNGGYPVPATKGGAVQTLVEHLVKENNEKMMIDLTVMSFHEEQAEAIAKDKYHNIRFYWVKRPIMISAFDQLIMYVVKTLFPSKKLLSFMSTASLLWYIWKACRLLRKESFGKVILENNIPLSWVIRLSHYSGSFYYHLHNIPRINAKNKRTLKQCTAFLCVSRFVGQEIAGDINPVGPIDKEKIRILYNCIDTKRFYQKKIDVDTLRKRFGINDVDHVLLYAGRLSREKGIDQLLCALDYLDNHNLKILIVGNMSNGVQVKDTYQRELFRLAEKHKDRIFFTGYIPQSELPDVYNFADISVLPSIGDEAAGLAMIESLACGTPVITTSSGGIPEYVEGGAIILERNLDLPKAIAENIEKLLSDKELYSDLSQKGMTRVHNLFGCDGYLERFVEGIQ